MLKAVIFDFDGLILDTEWPEYQSWCEIYESYGHTLSVEKWCLTIGAGQGYGFEPYGHLEELVGQPLDREAIRARRRARSSELIEERTVLEGVTEGIDAARSLGLKLGVASSSDADWVLGHLCRHDLESKFDTIVCADGNLRPKPDPDVYLEALDRLQVRADEAIALEDSPNGVAAAKAAGLYCVAIPNMLTSRLDLSGADLIVLSLAGVSLSNLAAGR
jgi:HAD superfamily hydrolase (TIGR01509 family)